MNKICVIEQPAGLGDIFYTQKIAKTILLQKKAGEIIWPVLDDFIYIKDYLKDNNIEYVKQSEFKEPENASIVRLRSADERHKDISIMSAKYVDAGLSEGDCLSYFNFKRNPKRESKLYDKLVNNEQDYIVRSMYYGSPPNSLERDVPYTGDKKIIDIEYYKDVNVFDWCKILENAKELHMVDTCFIYILEKLNLNCSIKKLYSRFKPADFSHIEHVPQKINWDFTQW
jgi:hypothetical protein